MDSVFNSKLVVESRETQYLAFILQSQEMFFQTGYKVLQNQEKKGFIKCTKVTHNGKIKLVYDIQKYKTLEALLPGLRPDTFVTILANLLEVIVEVKNNGFMQSDNIAISLDKIFIDCNNYKVYLIYLPLDQQADQNDFDSRIEDRLREIILAAVKTCPELEDNSVSELCSSIRNPAITAEALKELLNGSQLRSRPAQERPAKVITPVEEAAQEEAAASMPIQKKKKGLFSGLFKAKAATNSESPKTVSFREESEGGATEILSELYLPGILLSGVKTPEKVEMEINKAEFTIGKKADVVDGFISFNSAISRVHCKIVYKEGGYYMVDLGSANGTFVNGRRLAANQQVPIKTGDKIRLANSDFVIKPI